LGQTAIINYPGLRAGIRGKIVSQLSKALKLVDLRWATDPAIHSVVNNTNDKSVVAFES